MNNMKRILTIALCSVLIVCTIPQFSFRSEAASTSTYALYETLLTLSGYLASKGYSTFHDLDLSIPSVRELKEWTKKEQEDLLYDFAAELNSYGTNVGFPGLGDEIIRAFRLAGITGYLTLTQSARINFDNWIYGSTDSGSVSVSTISKTLESFYKPASYDYVTSLNGTLYNIVINSESCPIVYEFSSSPDSGYIYFLPTSLDSWVLSGTGNYIAPGTYPPYSQVSQNIYYNGKTYTIYGYLISNISLLSYDPYLYGIGPVINNATLPLGIFKAFYEDNLEDVVVGNIGTSQITDTSSDELLTSTNTIASDGTVEGDTTIYLPDTATLENAIDSYNSQSITLDEFLKILGINSVSSDATVAEKEDALTVVVTPTDDYLWFTKTEWGADSLEDTRQASASTRAEEDSLADSIANTLNGGSNPEHDEDGKSRGKGLLALLLLGLGIWNTPIIAGDGTPDSGGTDDGSTDGSGDTSGYLQESIAGMAVAGGIVEDLFSAAGGSDGYGLAYTVGASFVIFSVIIGAANYFGALFSGSDTKQNIKSSGKQSRSKSPSPKSKKGG